MQQILQTKYVARGEIPAVRDDARVANLDVTQLAEVIWFDDAVGSRLLCVAVRLRSLDTSSLTLW